MTTNSNEVRGRGQAPKRRVALQMGGALVIRLANYAENQGANLSYAMEGLLLRAVRIGRKRWVSGDKPPGGKQTIYHLPVALVADLDSMARKYKTTRPAIIRGLVTRALSAPGAKPRL